MTPSTTDTSTPNPAGARAITAVVVCAALAYAVIRYIVLGTVATSQLPVFVLNKALAVGAIALVAIALAIGPLVRLRIGRPGWIARRKAIGIHGFVLGMIHAVLTVATLSPVGYGKLFGATGALTFEGGLAILAGVLAAVALVVPAITSATLVRTSMPAHAWRRAQRLGIVALALGLGHVAVLGWRTWLTPAKWAGGLPPLTMIAVAIVVVAFAIRGAELVRRALARRAAARPARRPVRTTGVVATGSLSTLSVR